MSPHAVPVTLAALLVSACGRLGFDQPDTCAVAEDCASGHCIAGVCCDRACDGTCATCARGTCEPKPNACTGDCASCDATADGFTCTAVPEVCMAQCSSAVCSGGGAAFACDLSSCCASAAAPNVAGSCSMAPSVLLADGCRLIYDYSSYIVANGFVELSWDEQLCQQGSWMAFDSGADAVPCGSCAHETRNTWVDSCTGALLATTVCP